MSDETPKLDEPYVVDCDTCDFCRTYTTRHGALVAMSAHGRTESGTHSPALKHKDEFDDDPDAEREVSA